MFLPIADAPNPRGVAFATWTLIALNVAAFLLINVPLGQQRADASDPEFQEYVEFPYGATRDLMDALAYDVRVRKPASPDEIEKMLMAEGRGVWPSSTRDPVTGY